MSNVITTKQTTGKLEPLTAVMIDKVNEVKTKIRDNTGEMTTDDLVLGISNSRHLLFNYLMDNNLNSLAVILTTILQEKTDTTPNRAQVESYISGYIAKDEYGKLNTLLQNFKFNDKANNYTTDPEVLQKLHGAFSDHQQRSVNAGVIKQNPCYNSKTHVYQPC